jgi:hypothetical protein
MNAHCSASPIGDGVVSDHDSDEQWRNEEQVPRHQKAYGLSEVHCFSLPLLRLAM